MSEQAATRSELGFHWEGNVFWKRQDDGAVRVCLARNRLDGSDVYDVVWAYNIDPSSWASIVASVSALGENGETYRAALDNHNRLRIRAQVREDTE